MHPSAASVRLEAGVVFASVAAVQIHLHKPRAPLGDCVDVLWHCRSGPLHHARERILPTGAMALIINLREDSLNVFDRRDPWRGESRSGTLLVGPHTEFHVIDTDCEVDLMGVGFQPGGVARFLKIPAGELFDQQLDLGLLWGERAGELRERLRGATSIPARFRVLETALRAALLSDRRSHPVVAFALRELQSPRCARIADIVDQTGYSARRFIQLFTDEIGLTPKQFHRLQRFQRVVGQMNAAAEPDFADVALDCGYYDQAHFIHDFRRFAGVCPTAYLARRAHHPNHVVIEP